MDTSCKRPTAYKPDRYMLMHIILSLFLGAAWLWPWVYQTTCTLNDFKPVQKRRPAGKLLLFILVPFYSMYWFNKSAKIINDYSKRFGLDIQIVGLCSFLGLIAPSISSIIMQMEIEHLCGLEPISEKNQEKATVATETVKEIISDKPIFHDEENQVGIRVSKDARNTYRSERNEDEKIFDTNNRNALSSKDTRHSPVNIGYIYFLNRRFRIDILETEPFDSMKEKLCNINIMNNNESIFVHKIKNCSNFDEIFDVCEWFVNLYS